MMKHINDSRALALTALMVLLVALPAAVGGAPADAAPANASPHFTVAAALPPTAAAAQRHCYFARLVDRNLDAVRDIATRASGIGAPGSGQYLTPEAVADLSGRSRGEVAALASYVASRGGEVTRVAPLRNALFACFDGAAVAALEAAGGAGGRAAADDDDTAAVSALVAATGAAAERAATAAAAVATASAAAARALAAGMPPSLARIVRHITPLGLQQPRPADPRRHQPTQQQAAPPRPTPHHTPATAESSHRRRLAAGGPTVAAPLLPSAGVGVKDWTSPVDIYIPAVDGPYNSTTLPWGTDAYPLNVVVAYPGLPLGAGPAPAIVGVPFGNPFLFLGAYGGSANESAAYAVQNVNLLYRSPPAVLVPCNLTWSGLSSAVASVTYATGATAKECAPSFTVTFQANYAGNPAVYTAPRTINVPASSRAVSHTTCGQIVANSGGLLAPDLCATLAQRLTNNGIVNDVGNDTALFSLALPLVPGIPKWTGLNITTVVNPPASVGEPWATLLGQAATIVSDRAQLMSRPYTPGLMKRLYQVPGRPPAPPAGAAGTDLAVMIPDGSTYYYSPNDYETVYSALMGGAPPPAVGALAGPFFVANQPLSLYGPQLTLTSKGENPFGEPSLDIQYLALYGGDAPGARLHFGASSESNSQQSGNNAVQALYNLSTIPNVVSWSYGGAATEHDDADANYLMQLACAGVTVLAAAGDSGAWGKTGCSDDPVTNNQTIRPAYPASSPWVTAVGGSMLARPSAGAARQFVACAQVVGGAITAGGGFASLQYPRSLGFNNSLPSWQYSAVMRYIRRQWGKPNWPLNPALPSPVTGADASFSCPGSSSKPSECTFGRAIPDLVTNADWSPSMLSGSPVPTSGTSMSSPTFAGLVAHINAAIQATPGFENRTIGFMNPFLYWAAENYPGAFIDVTVGSNAYTSLKGNQVSGNCTYGYAATPGWDAVTGLGVPQISVLSDAAVRWVKLQASGSPKVDGGLSSCPAPGF